MRTENAGNINNYINYQSKTVKAGEKQQFSPLEVREETVEESPGQSEEMLSRPSGMSFDDWLQNMIQKKRFVRFFFHVLVKITNNLRRLVD